MLIEEDEAMELAGEQRSLLDASLGHFASLIGDRRTGRTLRATVQGIRGPRRW